MSDPRVAWVAEFEGLGDDCTRDWGRRSQRRGRPAAHPNRTRTSLRTCNRTNGSIQCGPH